VLKSDERRIRDAVARHDAAVRAAWAAGGSRDAVLGKADDMLRALVRLAARHELPADTEKHLEEAALSAYREARELADEILAGLKN